jgi:lipid-A-disaccharide synthase-like uncharacterized protein
MIEHLWLGVGLVGSLLFFGRFYVQWLASEWRGAYVVPVSFWYMSMGGALMLFAYAYDRGSPGGTFGLCFNILIYARNLMLIWKEQGSLTRLRNLTLWVVVGCIALVAVMLTALTWQRGYQPTAEFWAWSAVWVVGQGVFFMRFAVQWMATELNKRSTIPATFWYLSLVGMALHGTYFVYRQDWLLAFGTFADGIPYARNLWLMRKSMSG